MDYEKCKYFDAVEREESLYDIFGNPSYDYFCTRPDHEGQSMSVLRRFYHGRKIIPPIHCSVCGYHEQRGDQDADYTLEDQMTPYKKKASKKRPKKSDHKHTFMPCVFEYDGIKFDKAHGIVPTPDMCFGSYCTVCGKVGPPDTDRWLKCVPLHPGFGMKYTDEAIRELAVNTRTIPTFHLEDRWAQKYVSIETVEG